MLFRRYFALLFSLFLLSVSHPEQTSNAESTNHGAQANDNASEDAGEDFNHISLLSTRMIVEKRSIKASDDLALSTREHAPWTFYQHSLIPLLMITALAAWMTRPQLESADEITPAFRKHRVKFLAVWAVAVCADWLQGPYVYALYASFGYDKSSIDKLFVAGFASSMVFGTFAGSFADAWGRKRTTLAYCILYIMSCLSKHCSLYPVLMFGRITGGMATSLLFSAFECWLVSENNERHKFSPGLLRYMFSMMYFVNYLVAIVSGLFAQAMVDAVPMRKFAGFESLHYGGNICPFDLAILMLCVAFPLICFTWSENYGNSVSGQTTIQSFGAAYRAITSSWKVSILGIVGAGFEGSMYVFVINWTPSLGIEGAPPPPHGLIFSAMMMCCMVGSSVFSCLNPRVNPAKVIVVACFIACVSFALVAFMCGQAAFVAMVYMSFLVFESCVGLYMPAMGTLKSELVPEDCRAGVYNWYRIPLNIVVCSVILTDMQLRAAFIVCASLLAVGTTLILPLAITPVPQKFSQDLKAT